MKPKKRIKATHSNESTLKRAHLKKRGDTYSKKKINKKKQKKKKKTKKRNKKQNKNREPQG